MDRKRAIVIGAGIVGIAVARALAQKGYSVKLFERGQKATGASIRNFGMVWPIGQPGAKLYGRAMRSRQIWKDICVDAGIWHDPVGSLHLAYHPDEWEVLRELYEKFSAEGRQVCLLKKEEVLKNSEAVVPDRLLGGLYSAEEMIVDPRQAIAALPAYLREKWNVEFFWGKAVTSVEVNGVRVGTEKKQEADLIFVCSGADFETLYPEVFSGIPITKCKLQMMKLAPQPGDWRIGPALCGGLSLIHYSSFQAAQSLAKLRTRYELEMHDYLHLGIHVMVSQNASGELIIGDSHEYGLAPDPFDKKEINQRILDYLELFLQCRDWTVAETWHGVYPKRTDGKADFIFSPSPGVYIVNGVGGAGMTLSFGLAEEICDSIG